MRGFKVRLLSGGVLAALVAWAVTWGGHAVSGQPGGLIPAQPVGPGGVKKDEKKAKEDRSPEDENLPFAPPYERDHKRRLEGVRDYLNVKDPANIKWNEVCSFLQQILDSKSDSFFDVKYKAGDTTRVNRISVKTEANRIIATFSPEGLQFYQQAQGANAAGLLEDAVKANYDIAMLADLSQRYFHTKAGAEGTILLATIYLERGNFVEAAYAFERLLPRKDIDDLFTGAHAVQGVSGAQAQRRPAARGPVQDGVRPPGQAPGRQEGHPDRPHHVHPGEAAGGAGPADGDGSRDCARRRVGDAGRQPGPRRGDGRRPAVPRRRVQDLDVLRR